ncbi:peptidyl-prolyl cis-trans isomerase [Dacryopinax primogenitus]|uniref:peptidylprolyl isomerase n=1 Tax=Dacryopinax primogenitus (strain DJM 731) TaxID=1858805 RepID=M5GEF7_DACPD|nr:peptidyl-prolyl cis-trans isomerase [Dacryopinax primogenitus]EJU03203.1 peptidyl-prolyl cis-trans isomerase [Dacryopinax primogenitus]
MPMPLGEGPRKKRKLLPHESLFLEHLPTADRYWKSFMHRDFVNFVTVTKTEFIITTSVDGHVKFWKKQQTGVEFVKHYRAHLTAIVAVSASADGNLYASVAEDGTAKVFDVVNFDMINMIKLGFTPLSCCWVHGTGKGRSILAVSERGNSTIRFYDGRGDGQPFDSVNSLHRSPVHMMTARLYDSSSYSDKYDIVISADEGGFVEYWQPQEPWSLPKTISGLWQFKSNTDLYEFKRTKSLPTSLTLSPDSSHFVVLSMSDRQIRIFNFLTGKMVRKYDESLSAIQEMQQAETAVSKVEDMEFGRRLAAERELEKDVKAAATANAVWDESGNFVLYATLLGIKVINIVTNRVVRLLGKDETLRWLNLSLYQGAPEKKGFVTAAMAASANPILEAKETRDPTLFCTAFKRGRFYMFGRLEPEEVKGQGDRDVLNERPTRDEQTMAASIPIKKTAVLATQAVIHTELGDIHIRLFPEYAPKAVENFVGHAKSGYFEGVIFHRVIPKFMIQTGDPLGDGTGGTSIWGTEFEDEFTPALRHDRPYTVSMANAGPNTNGSQFFVTTTVCPWLDNKHTIFGRVVHGLEVVHVIENVKTDKVDKPYEDIKIVNVSVE